MDNDSGPRHRGFGGIDGHTVEVNHGYHAVVHDHLRGGPDGGHVNTGYLVRHGYDRDDFTDEDFVSRLGP